MTVGLSSYATVSSFTGVFSTRRDFGEHELESSGRAVYCFAAVVNEIDARWLEVSLPGGRILEVVTAGPEKGTPLVFNTGSPGAAAVFGPLVDVASDHGLRTIIYSRPGFGRSTRQEGRSVADAAADVSRLLDAIGADQFLTIGWSGGGPHALASASLLGDRCRAALVVSSLAPQGMNGLDWFAGMSAGNVEEYSTAQRGVDELRPFLEKHGAKLAKMQPADVGSNLTKRADIDPVVVVSFREFLANMFRRAVETGVGGWLDDDLAFSRPWGFDIRQISCPVAVWHGGKDPLVPPAHATWLAANIPAARLHVEPDEGHGSLLAAAHRRIVDDLANLTA